MCTPKVYHRIYAVTQTISQPVLAPCTGTQAGTEALRRFPRPSPAPELRGNLNSVAANRHFFFCAVGVRSAAAAGLGPDRPAARARAALCYQADGLVAQMVRGIGPTRQPRPPRCSRWRRAVQVRCRCATRPRRSALVDSGACSIRSGARVQLGMRKGDHDMVHGLACMRGCSLVVQRVERGANFKNRV